MARANPFRFSTKYQDDETDLLYYSYRYYSAGIGRWLSHDPIEEEGGTGLDVFIQNDGLNGIDVLGLQGDGGLAQGLDRIATSLIDQGIGITLASGALPALGK